MRFFDNRKKNKFLFVNRLKYGADKKPVYTTESMTDALMIGDEEKATEILNVLLERHAKELKGK